MNQSDTKHKILALLEANRDKYLSGEGIATAIGLSRNAVWKGISELRVAGYTIDAITNKGYKLSSNNDIMSVEGIAPYLHNKSLLSSIYVYDEIDSTNKKAKELAVAGAEHGTVVVSDMQTLGRGRFSRAFHSPSNTGIYMSVIIRPDQLPLENTTIITAHTANVVCEALSTVAKVQPGIKWVNDIYLDSKKVCGILTEGSIDFETGLARWIVVGIGINVYTPKEGYPDEIKNIAGSICGSTIIPNGRNRIVANIINGLLDNNVTEQNIMKQYKSRLLMLGKRVRVLSGNEEYYAIAKTIDGVGHLIVERDDGSVITLNAGEISIKL